MSPDQLGKGSPLTNVRIFDRTANAEQAAGRAGIEGNHLNIVPASVFAGFHEFVHPDPMFFAKIRIWWAGYRDEVATRLQHAE